MPGQQPYYPPFEKRDDPALDAYLKEAMEKGFQPLTGNVFKDSENKDVPSLPPNFSGLVMDPKLGERARSIVGDRKEGRPVDDFYPTPPAAVEALLEVEKFPEYIWEPACGSGSISKVLEAHGHKVCSSDLYDHGYGSHGMDFLEAKGSTEADMAIITNPPFRLCTQFIRHAWFDLGCTKFAFLLKLAALEGIERTRILMYTPLKRVYVFRKRLQLTRNGDSYRNRGMIAFAWFVWEAGWRLGFPTIGWL